MHKRLIVAGATAGLIVGGAAGLAIGIVGSAGAQTTPGSTVPGATAPATPPTTAKGATGGGSNEDPTHEATETPQREAEENSGNFHHHGGPAGSNEDPTHEASESPEREAQEGNASGGASTQTPAAPSTTAPNTPTGAGV